MVEMATIVQFDVNQGNVNSEKYLSALQGRKVFE